MAGKSITERERKYLLHNHIKVTQAEAAKRLGRSERFVWRWVRDLGIAWGAPKGYVRVRDVCETEGQVNAMVAVAKEHGAYFRTPKPKMPHCVREEWLDWYLQRRMRWTGNDALARREGWFTTPELAAILEVDVQGLAPKLRSGKKSLGKAFAGVATMRGSHGRIYYEPTGTRSALAKLGVQMHRRAA